MKRFYLTAVIAGATFFSVETATAQVASGGNQNETATEQTQQKGDFQKIQEQELPNEVRQSVQRDYQGATVSEAYVKEKEGDKKFKLVLQTEQGQSKEVYADAQGNWIEDKEKKAKKEE